MKSHPILTKFVKMAVAVILRIWFLGYYLFNKFISQHTIIGYLVRMDESPAPGEFWLQFPRVIGERQLGDPTPPGWPLWRTTYLCTTLPWRMLSNWLWISRFGDYW